MCDYTYYIDKAIKMQGFKYDYELADKLGFKPSMIARLRKNKAHIGEEKMIKLAELAGENDVKALMDYTIMRASGTSKKTWLKALNQIQQSVSSILFIALLTVFMAPHPAQANISKAESVKNIYYGKLRRFLWRVGGASHNTARAAP